MKRLSCMFCCLILFAACGQTSQRTPEPDETEKVNALVEQLGTDLTYNSKTLLMNPEADGRTLARWIDRRRSTLDGTLRLSEIPAVENPGTVEDTLEWERKAREIEAERGDAHRMRYTNYIQWGEDRARTCPELWKEESRWLESQRVKHMKTVGGVNVDWDEANKRFQVRCDREIEAHNARQNARMETERAAKEQFWSELAAAEGACRAHLEASQMAYAADPNEETRGTAQAVEEDTRRCMESVERRRHDFAGQDRPDGM